MNRPTMQDIADAVSTSRISVWKALNNRPGVSKELRKQIHERAEKMGYFKNMDYFNENKSISSSPRTIAAVVSRPESSLFWMQIIHQIAKELAQQNINLMYTYLPTFYETRYALPPSLSNGSISGIIVLNVYSEPLLKLLAELSLPKVFLDTVPSLPFEQLNGDLVLLEGRNLIRKITGRLLDSGRTRLGFVGDINYAQTNLDRYQGFLDAFKERGLNPNPSLSMVEHIELQTHYEKISEYLSKLKTTPEGLVCASDYIAHFVERYFKEQDTASIQNVLLTGFDNNSEYDNISERITTVDVQTQALGSRLVSKILFAIEHPEVSPEETYVTSKIIYRKPIDTEHQVSAE